MIALSTVFALLALYQLKHFVADYALQGQYMLGKFKADWSFLGPLAAHASVHGAMTFAIAFVFTGGWLLALSLAALDFTLHFTMDRLKAGPKYMGRWKPLTGAEWVHANGEAHAAPGEIPDAYIQRSRRRLRGNKLFWISLGIDQAVHHLTHYALIWIILRHIR